LKLSVEHPSGQQGGEGVADGGCHPYACLSEEVGEYEEQGDEEEQLAGEGEEDALFGHADALEEVDGHHLETDDGEGEHQQEEAVGGLADELVVGGEGACHQLGYEGTGEEGGRGDEGGGIDGEAHHPVHTVELAGTVVVSGNGLHALVKAHDYHHEEEYHAVGYAVGSDGEVATVLLQPLVDEDDNEAGAEVHQEGREADGQGVADNLGL